MVHELRARIDYQPSVYTTIRYHVCLGNPIANFVQLVESIPHRSYKEKLQCLNICLALEISSFYFPSIKSRNTLSKGEGGEGGEGINTI